MHRHASRPHLLTALWERVVKDRSVVLVWLIIAVTFVLMFAIGLYSSYNHQSLRTERFTACVEQGHRPLECEGPTR